MTSLSEKIKSEALRLGFSLCGIAKAGFLEKEAVYLEKWLNDGRNGTMKWMENHFEKRVDPGLLVENAKSVISVLHNYFPQPEFHQPTDAPLISKYAWGRDYHLILKEKLSELLDFIRKEAGQVNARIFTDSAPVMDKAWAQRAGLGWIGKHTNLISIQRGSWFFIGEIILDLSLGYDEPATDHCGSCTKCLEACPTQALTPYEIDSTKCISYLTIELREKTPAEFNGKMDGWTYGCDICQDVCPWNSFSIPENGSYQPLDHILKFHREDWEKLGEQEFKKLTRESAMSRIKWEKMRENIIMGK